MRNFLKHNFLNPLKEFLQDSKAIGVILFCCTCLSILLSNIAATQHFWHSIFTTHFIQLKDSSFHFPSNLKEVIDDLFMSIFFFVVSMEIKREVVFGELSSIKKSSLPIIGALGGMVFPALVFLLFNFKTQYQNGWAIPTATDIAFAIGIASLFGNKISNQLKVFLVALAIIDDLGAIIIIAFFYNNNINYFGLISSFLILISLYKLQKTKYNFGMIQLVLAAFLWYFVCISGIHATIAGVAFAAFVPNHLLSKLQLKLHNLVYFFILPLFALANTNINLFSQSNTTFTSTLSLGVFFGLLIGKPIGIILLSFVAVKLKIAELPIGIGFKQLFSVAILGGIGFTMSFFITNLAFNNELIQQVSKISIIVSAMFSVIFCWIYLSIFNKKHNDTKGLD